MWEPRDVNEGRSILLLFRQKFNKIIKEAEISFEKMNHLISKHKILFAFLFSIIVSSVCFLHSAYEDTDNCIISMIVNSYYGKDNYCIFMNYIFCQIVRVVDSIFPYADGYILICHLFLYISTFWLCYIIVSKSENVFKRIMLLSTVVIVIFSFDNRDLSNTNFTIQAGAMASVGAISIFSGTHSKRVMPYLIMAIIYLSFGAMIRMSGCLLVIPYICLHICFDLICTNDKRKIGRAIILTVIPLIFVAGIYATNTYINRSEKYLSANQFNSERSSFLDYPKNTWLDVKDHLPELTENDYFGIKQHLYGDTSRMDTEFFENINKYAKKNPKFSLSNVSDSFYDAVSVFGSLRKYSLFYLIIIFFYIMFSKLNVFRKIEVILAVLGTLIIAMFFAYFGRIFIRVIATPVIMYVVIVNMQFLFEDIIIKENKQRYAFAFTSFASALLGVILISITVATAEGFSSALFARIGADEHEFEKYYSSDNLYVWSTRTLDLGGYEYFAKQGKLPTEEFLLHNVPYGQYTYGQVFMEEYFDKIGTHNPVRALIDRENTFYVAEDVSIMENYLRDNVDENIYSIKVDTINNIPVWKFKMIE